MKRCYRLDRNESASLLAVPIRHHARMTTLEGTIALVAGATRGAGRGIAVELGEAGATVYCTGRSTRGARSEYDRPETIEETAELVDEAGGARHRRADRPPRARRRSRALVARIDAEQGRLDVLVNDVWGGEKLFEWDTPVWEHDLDNGLRLLRLARRHAPDHEPLRAAAADPPARRPGRRDDRRHRRLQRRELPHLRLLRPRQDRGHPAGLRPVARARAARRHRRRAHARAGCARR